MAAIDSIIDLSLLNCDHVIADIEAIRKIIPQRFEMEQLTAIVFTDPESNVCVGYRDTSEDDFWVRGHMPGMPLMPGVLMCEAAAQLCTYHAQVHDLMGCEMLGFGGLDDVKFRGVVRPGDRLIIAGKLIKVRRGALIRVRFQCFVDQSIVCEGEIKGIKIPVEALRGD